MKKILFFTGIFTGLLIAVNAFAQETDFDYAAIYTVGGSGNTTQKDVFLFGEEKPWLFLEFEPALLPTDEGGKSWTISNWIWDGSNGLPYVKFKSDTHNGVWLTFSDAQWRDIMEEAGNWSISAGTSLELPDGSVKSYSGTTAFKVTVIPEPASTALFILGAAAFGMGILRKRSA